MFKRVEDNARLIILRLVDRETAVFRDMDTNAVVVCKFNELICK